MISLRPDSAIMVKNHLKELNRVRTKLGYSKIKPKKIINLRKRVRYHLESLRRYLPRTPSIKHPCDPKSWDIKHLTKEQKEEYRKAWQSFVTFFNHNKNNEF